MSEHIVQEHEHIMMLSWVDGKLKYKCSHHECEYVEEPYDASIEL